MTNGLLIGIAYNGQHNKGDEPHSPQAVMVPPHEHADWLLRAVEFYKRTAFLDVGPTKVAVVAVGLPSILEMTAPGERDPMWNVISRAKLLTYPRNEGHQIGASTCLRLGLEAAGYWGFPYYIHTAEDIIPRPGVLAAMLAALEQGADYAGYSWSDCLNCSFFGCRTTSLAGCFDREGVRGHRGLEHYLTHLLQGKKCEIFDGGGRGRYLTTHDYRQYCRWLEKMPESDAPPTVRTMKDYEEGRHLA